MTQQSDRGDFCLECHWEAFKMAAKNPLLSSNCMDFACWDSSEFEHCPPDAHCTTNDPCCDEEDCSVNCSSVCDGFIDCDAASDCSDQHCNDTNCQPAAQVCFDKDCVGDDQAGANQASQDLLGQDGAFNWNSDSALSSANAVDVNSFHQPQDMTATNVNHDIQAMDNILSEPSSAMVHSGMHGNSSNGPFEKSTNTQNFLPFHIHSHGQIHTPTIEEILGLCPNISDCTYHSQLGNAFLHHNPDDIMGLMSTFPHGSCQYQLPHSHDPIKLSIEPSSQGQVPHSSSQTVSSATSSPLASSPLTSPMLGKATMCSPVTSPEITPTSEAHVCRWVSGGNLANGICGASFSDSCQLQEHLIAKHVGMIEGKQGNGYYCCWEGCHRPHEPFSQKSKLQGHFLTHSNCTFPRSLKILYPKRNFTNVFNQTKTFNVPFVESRLQDRQH